MLTLIIPEKEARSYQEQVKLLEPLMAPGCTTWWGDEAVVTDVDQLNADIPCHTVYVIGWHETRKAVQNKLLKSGKRIIAVVAQ